jgi:hypothetical protein
MAVTNSAATLPGITVPIFVGKLTHSDVSLRKKNLYQFRFSINLFKFYNSQQLDLGKLFSGSRLFST